MCNQLVCKKDTVQRLYLVDQNNKLRKSNVFFYFCLKCNVKIEQLK